MVRTDKINQSICYEYDEYIYVCYQRCKICRGLEILHQEIRGQVKIVVMEHFNQICTC